MKLISIVLSHFFGRVLDSHKITRADLLGNRRHFLL